MRRRCTAERWLAAMIVVVATGCPTTTTTTTTTTTSTTKPTTTSTTTLPPDTTPPSSPTGLSAAAASCSQVNLGWNAATDTGGSGLKGYDVYRNGAFLKRVLVPATSTSDTGLAASTV
jgi:chitinase